MYLLSVVRTRRTVSRSQDSSRLPHYQKMVFMLTSAFLICSSTDHFLSELFQPESMTRDCKALGTCESLTWWLGAFVSKSNMLCLIFFSGLTFLNVMRTTAVLAIAMIPQFITVNMEREDGSTVAKNQLNGFEFLSSVSFLMLAVVVLRVSYRWDRLQRKYFFKSYKLVIQQQQFCTMASIMLPNRLVGESIGRREDKTEVMEGALEFITKSPGHHTESPFKPVLIVEEYRLVTVMFCSLTKTDVSNLTNPSDFLRRLGNIYAIFDLAVHGANMYKVEHVCEDYVVASSVIEVGPDSEGDNPEAHSQDAKRMVLLGSILLGSVAAADRAEQRSDSEFQLEFKVGIHSGRVIGG
eukprot:CAMPEP_0118956674 /NCGR_PEP_ID=MMETSP1169-20130426/61704_1 /TAXON_ID=36882 /ORGANISM="Pyramimonas obovata, Strain CCMP722" /LENGTH=352 /DNA_ID=CAMNT_0006904717 /DNA_START=564 /DNA_END=1619 /DNA_ORIENTATION=+